MSFTPAPQQPSTALNAEAARLEQRQLDDRAARYAQTHQQRAGAPLSLHRMVARVRAAMRAHPSAR